MASHDKNSSSDSLNARGRDPELNVLERVQELTWALLDENISDDEMSLLDTLLLTGESARNRYIECVQLHTDLMAHYNAPEKTAAAAGAGTPVLSFLSGSSFSSDVAAPNQAN